MEIVFEKPVEKLVYTNHHTKQDEILEDGVIISKHNLVSPMRTRFESNLSRTEPHIGFKNREGVQFIPIKDIITLKYY